jgi:Ca2+-binding EF-hand superfamily protein
MPLGFRYDEGNKGYIDHKDLKHMLQALGMLSSLEDKDQFVAAQIALASKGSDKQLTCEEFCAYYSSLQFAGEPFTYSLC